MSFQSSRRTFLLRSGQVVAAGGTLELLLAACGGNIATTPGSSTPGTAKIPDTGLMVPGQLQWGADYVDGAPYVFKDPTNPNNLIGFEVEIAAAMAKLMSAAPKMIETDYGKLEPALLANQFDFVMNGWEVTPDRQKTELFSDPYYRYGQQFVVRSDDSRYANLSTSSNVQLKDFEGLKVGTGTGFKAADYLATDAKVITRLYDGNLPMDDVKQKKIDAMLVDVPIAAYYVLGAGPAGKPDTALKPIGKPLYLDNYVVGINKANPHAQELLKEVNQAIAELKKNGALKKIYQEWSMWNDQQAEIGIS
ncbi:amino acid ABC transporter substrate-binding protein [Ktedonosporobacter rubrisoli]|uniref:Amino acid ABC transporter substrate-binding protein n=1 Tax=Ktedonosporobacter rubrisoli TaxID=2509675 RepID=A0A4P6K0Y6_KTERU|nr:ABC transporter substrate-binding protein [Ktedonosporobacter rubrisoli]QBD81807.1 amino acid ABC transporter substrate-binding protein [Ktedonosporobacter rubrisoli]